MCKHKYEDFADDIVDVKTTHATDLTGIVCNELTVVAMLKPKQCGKQKKTMWLCRCSCGNYHAVDANRLSSKRIKSCGCKKPIPSTKTKVKKDFVFTEQPEYSTWMNMKAICYNPNNPAYNDYGGRGIQVCDRWLESFENFYNDMGKKPTSKHSLDRIDVNGDYCPENCRWADDKTQANNTRRNHFLEYNGIKHTLAEWSRIIGKSHKLISDRLSLGWSIGEALEFEQRKKKQKKEVVKKEKQSRRIDMTNVTYESGVTALEFLGNKPIGNKGHKRAMWLCRCSCGKEFIASGADVRNGHTTSCGCGIKRMEKLNAHKMNKTLEYRSWNNMKQMCDNKNNPSYKNYGGKWISYCEDWSDFRKFYEDMGDRPVKSAKLARYDETKDFSKDNCYWKVSVK